MITLRFVGYTGFYAYEIRRISQGFWATHAECVIDGKIYGAHRDGVTVVPVGYDKGTYETELYVHLNTAPEVQTAFEGFIKEQVGKPYDTTAIRSMLVDFITTRQVDWRAPDSWFCSELIAAGLEACGWLRKIATGVNHVTPRDLVLLVSTRISIAEPLVLT